MKDSELKQAVETALHGEVRLRGRAIHVLVDAGRVELRGEVERLAEKRLALNLVRKLKAVDELKDALRLPSAGELSDAQICQHIQDALIQDPNLHEQQVRIAAVRGAVTLTGWTNSLEEKQLIGLSSWWVPGVVDVENRIEVIPAQLGDDGELLDVIGLAFEKDVLINPSNIAIRVLDRVVTLVGRVRSEDEKLACEHDCYYIWGVEEVDNRLVVGGISSS
jgi:osmotically-inducible protein OsmY